MKAWFFPLLLLSCPGFLAAQDKKTAEPEDPVHGQLRALKKDLVEAFNKNDLDTLLKQVHPNVVVTWQDAEISRGHDGIRTYYKKMMEGPNKIVNKVTAEAEVDELAILHGDKNALAFGTLNQDFKLTNGLDFKLKNRWTADLVKDGDQWKIAGLHVSANLFDNAVMRAVVSRTITWCAGIGLAVGFVLGLIVSWVLGKLRKKTA